MKVVAFNGSPHPDGVVARGISIMAGELAGEGIDTLTVHVGAGPIQGCMACMWCRKAGNEGCVIEGDPVNEAREMLSGARGVILGSPVYYGGIAGTFKCFLDRLFYSGSGLGHKVGATVVSLRRSGGVAVFHQLNNYLNLAQAVITPGIYWDVIHGSNAGETMDDLEGVQIMETQGRNMAWLIKALASGSREFPPPPTPKRKHTNFIR